MHSSSRSSSSSQILSISYSSQHLPGCRLDPNPNRPTICLYGERLCSLPSSFSSFRLLPWLYWRYLRGQEFTSRADLESRLIFMKSVCQTQQPCHSLSVSPAVPIFASIGKHEAIAPGRTLDWRNSPLETKTQPSEKVQDRPHHIYPRDQASQQVRHLAASGEDTCVLDITHSTHHHHQLHFRLSFCPLQNLPRVNFVSNSIKFALAPDRFIPPFFKNQRSLTDFPLITLIFALLIKRVAHTFFRENPTKPTLLRSFLITSFNSERTLTIDS